MILWLMKVLTKFNLVIHISNMYIEIERYNLIKNKESETNYVMSNTQMILRIQLKMNNN